jgi:hypothetical protein
VDLGAKPIWERVGGSPFQPGDRVIVTLVCDEVGRECGLEVFVGQRGVVDYLEYSCGSGQHFPDDPMVGVRVGDEVVEFWKDELQKEEH